MKAYKKHHNSGPVPHPDQSGKYLQEGEIVYGDEWEPLVALDFVVAVEDSAPVALPESVKAPEPKPVPVVVAPPAPEPEPVQQSAVSEAEMGDGQEESPLVSDDPSVAQKGRRRKNNPSNV